MTALLGTFWFPLKRRPASRLSHAVPTALSGLKPEPSMIEPGTNDPVGSNPPEPTPWSLIWWCRITFSVYSPCGLPLDWAFGHTTTMRYRSAVVGVDAWMAAWMVEYCLPGPTSASRGLVAELGA